MHSSTHAVSLGQAAWLGSGHSVPTAVSPSASSLSLLMGAGWLGQDFQVQPGSFEEIDTFSGTCWDFKERMKLPTSVRQLSLVDYCAVLVEPGETTSCLQVHSRFKLKCGGHSTCTGLESARLSLPIYCMPCCQQGLLPATDMHTYDADAGNMTSVR